jgi:hypothetical protein
MKKASDAAKSANKKLEAMARDNQAWYDKNYNEDPLQRVSSQRVLSQPSDMLRQRNKTAAGRAAVLGGSSEAVAAQGDQNASIMADAMGRIAAQNEARKDDIEQQYRERKNAIEQEKMNVENQRAQSIAQATAAMGSAIGNAASSAMGVFGSKGGGATGDAAMEEAYKKGQAAKITFKPSIL